LLRRIMVLSKRDSKGPVLYKSGVGACQARPQGLHGLGAGIK